MKLITKLISVFIVLFITDVIFSQEEKLPDIIISIAEELAADDSDPEAATIFIERLSDLAEDPVRINSSDESELSRLFFLSDFQIKAIADYIHSTGRIVSVYELANIPGFDKESVKMIIPFITLENITLQSPDPARMRNSIITNLTLRSGSADTSNLGSPWKILSKYKFAAGSFSGGITTEKDAGERFLSGNPPLPDFLSGHLAFIGRGLIRKIIIGDFGAHFGQGTNLNTGIRTGVSLTTTGYMSGRDEFRPYTSTDENNFFRGAAAEFLVRNLGFSIFFSRNRSDATVGSSAEIPNNYIENLYLAGLHNTPSLLRRKDTFSETSYGLNLYYNFKNTRVSVLWSHSSFSIPVQINSNNPEDLYDFTGDRNDLFTLNYSSLIKRMLLFGEFTLNNNSYAAFVQGISFRPDDRLSINLLYRNYSSGFTSFHGKGPGSSSVNRNETGIMGNFTFEAAKHLFISAGCDIQKFPWLRYSSDAPSYGKKEEIRLKYLPTEKLTIEVVYTYRETMINNSDNGGVRKQQTLACKSLKGVVRYNIIDNMTLITRVDYKIVNPSGSKGMLLLQDINYRFKIIPVSCWLRFCTFNTDDWDSRLYTYENDLLYSFSIPALSGKGSRAYLMAGWKPGSRTEVRAKYGITSKEEIPGGVRNSEDLKIQFRIRF